MEQINLKLTSDVKKLFQDVYEELKSSGEVSTLNGYMEYLLEKAQNPPKIYINSPEVSSELASVRNTNSQLRIELAEEKFRHQKEEAAFKNENILLKAVRPERVEVERIVERPLTENQLLIEMPPWVKVLLSVTVERLSKKYNKTISAEDILVSMFARYTLEKRTDWFYDFIINTNELERLTGHSIEKIKQLKKGFL